MKAKLFSAVCLAVAVFAASSCRAEPDHSADYDRAIMLSRELAMTLGACEPELGPDRIRGFRSDVALVFSEEQAEEIDAFYQATRMRSLALQPGERAELFTPQACWVKTYELTRELNRVIDRLPRVRQVASR